MNIQINIPKKVFVKIYYNSKKKHSIYIMKVLIIIFILLICFIIIKSNYESFQGLGGTTTAEYEDIEDIEVLVKNNLLDKTIKNKLAEYKQLKENIETNQINNIETDIESLKKRYNNTKIQLENILFNKFKPNRLDFNEKQKAFKFKLNSFIDDLKGEKLKITNYGSVDTEVCRDKWRLPENVPPINNKEIKNENDVTIRSSYFDSETRCCLDKVSKDECIKKYKRNIKLYNEYKLVLKNQNNKKIELNKINDDLYIINLNNKILSYKDNKYDTIPLLGSFENISSINPDICFRLVEIKDLVHLNEFIINDNVENILIEYPLYLISPKDENFKGITIHNKTELDNERLSIQSFTKEMINNQIFYKN